MNIQELTDDAKVILLLCGRFSAKNENDEVKPLTLREYDPLVGWLQDLNLRPSDLLNEKGEEHLENPPPAIDANRLKQLLSRGASMALAIENWINHGLWVVCRSDNHYPHCLKNHLKRQAPPILFGIGDINQLDKGGLSIVGSRNLDKKGEEFIHEVASESARQRIQIISGGARGVDKIAMTSALESEGDVVGILADSLLKQAVSKIYREAIRRGKLTLISPYSPDAGFNVGNAMGRNKLIYALADFALIISTDEKKGGTWAGATEELKRETPRVVFVRDGENVPKGNKALMELGAHPFPIPPWKDNLRSQLNTFKSNMTGTRAMRQLRLFNDNR